MNDLNNIVQFPGSFDDTKPADDMDYKLYVIAEVGYKNTFPGLGEEELFPEGWYSNTDYKKKNEIIAQAMQTKALIKDTPMYQEMKQNVL